MELTRDKLLMIGTIALLLGIQFRLVDTFVLNREATQFIRSKVQRVDSGGAVAARTASFLPPMAATLQRWSPPRWLGWALISTGAVMSLHVLAIDRSRQ